MWPMGRSLQTPVPVDDTVYLFILSLYKYLSSILSMTDTALGTGILC